MPILKWVRRNQQLLPEQYKAQHIIDKVPRVEVRGVPRSKSPQPIGQPH